MESRSGSGRRGSSGCFCSCLGATGDLRCARLDAVLAERQRATQTEGWGCRPVSQGNGTAFSCGKRGIKSWASRMFPYSGTEACGSFPRLLWCFRGAALPRILRGGGDLCWLVWMMSWHQPGATEEVGASKNVVEKGFGNSPLPS